ncbi:nicotinamide riboside transporter PnuC [Proteiniphilum sp. UBA5384]|uniref:nicotinamide riboside transporter PnuC n=1 Tax=Proteiniphilum sp. UBA5384 TaxID=1947279 RepID=UPI0025F091B7|nr:nicotinamide riboside transporter PnuC [Proteiniphilum sp. UBA5384]
MQTIEIIGAIIGLLYLYLEYKANKWLWPVGVLMPVVYVWIFFQSKFYADMGINVYYFFASIYGWVRWTKHQTEGDELPISHTPRHYILPLSVIGSALFAIIAFILIRFTDSPVPYGDSFTTALSILGMWLLAHKYVEQWWFWFVVNFISCGLYVWKGLYPTSILFAIYSVISVFGYFKWKRMMAGSQAMKNETDGSLVKF